jgi:hypothetical protein
MVVVRYATLLALVAWLGEMQCALFTGRPDYAEWLPFACGGLVMVGLFTMKFLGPPPHGFVPRIGLVFLMLCIAVFDRFTGTSLVPIALNIALGLTLLGWYARE